MGVKGLQTFLKENRQSLCRTLVLDRDGARDRAPVPVVVDAWGVIYQLYLDSLPWTGGGEYLRFYLLVRELVEGWRSVGLDPVFVFDGASPPEKHETILQRMAGQVSTARVFYSLSASTRSSPHFSNKGDTILPPFCRGAFAAALASLGVRMHFVPRGEADGVCVVLADAAGGYVLGRDTDFVILGAGASDRLRGYAPLDMLEWTDSAPPADAGAGAGADAAAPAAAGNFTTVAARRPRSARSRLLPPATTGGNPTLVLATFATGPLCRRLRLDALLLPLLSSLVGNDYTPAWAGEALFPRMRPGDRIERVARVLAELRPGAGAADELVRRAVRRLWARPFVDDADVAELTDAVIDATIQYVLPAPDCCAVFPFCGELDAGCRTASASRATSAAASRAATPSGAHAGPAEAEAEHEHPAAVVAYAAAQREGRLNALTAAYLHPDRVHLWSALEDPATASCRASAAAGRARLAAYTILDGAVGGLRFPPASDEMLDEQRQDNEANRLLGIEADEAPRAEERPRVVTEYLRQGGGRIVARRAVLPPRDGEASGAEEDAGGEDGAAGKPEAEKRESGHAGETAAPVPVPVPAADATPECLLPLAERQRLYLHHLGADTAAVLALPARLHPLVAAVRLILSAGGDWTRPEIEALLRGGIGSLAAWDAVGPSSAANGGGDAPSGGSGGSGGSGNGAESTPSSPERPERGDLQRVASGASLSLAFDPACAPPPAELGSRAVRLVAALTSALQDSQPLAQALLLPAPHGAPHVWIAGAALHALLAGADPAPGAGWAWSRGARDRWRRAVAAATEGFDLPAAQAESRKTRKKNKKKARNADKTGSAGAGASAGGAGAAGGGGAARKDAGKKGPANRFDLLVGM